jgi:hypothetical protein
MGQGFSQADAKAFKKMAMRVNNTSLMEVLNREENSDIAAQHSNEVELDTTIEALVQRLSELPGGAAVIVDAANGREVVGTIDIHMVLAYLIDQYKGALHKVNQVVVHREYDPWFWTGYDEWVERRVAIVPSGKLICFLFGFFF